LLWLFKQADHHNSNNTHYQFWQQHNHAIELNTNEVFDQRLDYIHNDPVHAGIVRYPEHPEQYLYSSAGNYARLPDNVFEIMPV
jgi:putative transposase